MHIWGDYYAGECVHGEPVPTCGACRDAVRDSWWEAVPLLVAVLSVAGFLLLGVAR